MSSNGTAISTPNGHRPVGFQTEISLWVVAAVVILLIHDIGGLRALTARPAWSPDYLAAMRYVASRHLPGEPVLVALPPPAYVALGEKDDIVFVSSPLDRIRAQQYTRQLADGRYADFWLGVPSIVSVEGLCHAFTTSPDLWLVVDDERLGGDWAFAGPMADAMLGLTVETYRAPGGVSVRRLIPAVAMDPTVAAVCGAPTMRNGAVAPS